MRVPSWRRRRWRSVAAAVVALSLVLAGLGFWFSRFPAKSESLGRLPFEHKLQRGVPSVEVEQIRDGLQAMDAYLSDDVGVAVPGRSRSACPGRTAASCSSVRSPGPVGWVDGRDFMYLNAANPPWRHAVRGHAYYPACIAANEHVHNMQVQLGCYREENDHEWQWLFEGMAIELAYEALVAAELVTEAETEFAIWEYRGLQDDNGNLWNYERSSDAAGDVYGLFHPGARTAFEEAGTPVAFVTFCRSDAAGVPWRDAFADAFGITVPAFYRQVEAELGQAALGVPSRRVTDGFGAPASLRRECPRAQAGTAAGSSVGFGMTFQRKAVDA